jgi:hypothetical protein
MNLTILNQGRLYQRPFTKFELKLLKYSLLPVAVALMLTLPARDAAPQENPFSAYADLFPGQPGSSTESKDFHCGHDAGNDPSRYCVLRPADGPFSIIGVRVLDRTIVHLNFTLRPNQYRVGDLALLWGRPQVKRNGENMNFAWPSSDTRAATSAQKEQVNYFLPVLRVWMSLD